MPNNLFVNISKKSIDLLLLPVRKSKTLLEYILNHTLRKEIEAMSDNGILFPLNHIQQSIKLSRKLLNRNFIILDIGGGIGASLNLFINQLPDKKIIVFEPVTESYKTIKERFPDSKNIEFIKAAVGNENTEKEINITGRITSSSLLPLVADPGSEVFNEKNLGQVRVEIIRIVRLDDFLAKNKDEIGIMKIDVQGFEMDVLKGAETTLGRTDIIVLEANNHDGYKGSAKYFDIDNYLRNHNFTLFNIFPSIVDDGKLKEWDVIYMNNSAKCVLE
jgi:FkbM family methyltransferase